LGDVSLVLGLPLKAAAEAPIHLCRGFLSLQNGLGYRRFILECIDSTLLLAGSSFAVQASPHTHL